MANIRTSRVFTHLCNRCWGFSGLTVRVTLAPRMCTTTDKAKGLIHCTGTRAARKSLSFCLLPVNTTTTVVLYSYLSRFLLAPTAGLPLYLSRCLLLALTAGLSPYLSRCLLLALTAGLSSYLSRFILLFYYLFSIYHIQHGT